MTWPSRPTTAAWNSAGVPTDAGAETSGALAWPVVTSKVTTAESMPELFVVAASIAASSVNATRCTLWSLLPTHRSTCALFTIFFNCAAVLSIWACVGVAVVLLPRLWEILAGAAATPSMFTSPDTLSESIPSTLSLETEALSRSLDGSPIAARILPASRLLVETPAGSAVPVVEESVLAGRSYHLPSIWIHDLPPPLRISACRGDLPNVTLTFTSALLPAESTTPSTPRWIGCFVKSASCWLVGAPLMSTVTSSLSFCGPVLALVSIALRMAAAPPLSPDDDEPVLAGLDELADLPEPPQAPTSGARGPAAPTAPGQPRTRNSPPVRKTGVSRGTWVS